MVDFKRMLHTPVGQMFISVILGLGLATLFRRVCKDKDCIAFNGPVLSEVDGKIFKHGGSCYKYEAETVPCDATKRTVDTAISPAVAVPGAEKNIYGY